MSRMEAGSSRRVAPPSGKHSRSNSNTTEAVPRESPVESALSARRYWSSSVNAPPAVPANARRSSTTTGVKRTPVAAAASLASSASGNAPLQDHPGGLCATGCSSARSRRPSSGVAQKFRAHVRKASQQFEAECVPKTATAHTKGSTMPVQPSQQPNTIVGVDILPGPKLEYQNDLNLKGDDDDDGSVDDDDPNVSGGDDEECEDEEGSAAKGSRGQQEEEDAALFAARDVALTHILSKDEPVRAAPDVVIRRIQTPFVWQSVTPFPHRFSTIVFPPADAPWEGDPQANTASAYVTPSSLDPSPTMEGRRKRIGRRGKFADLIYDLPEGSVRFSSVLAIFGTAGFRERDPDEDDESSWSLRWTKRVEFDEYKTLLPQQKVNHFPGNWGIGRKDNLHRHLTKCAQRFGTDVYNFHPAAWLLPQERDALARDMAVAECPPPGMYKNVYIVKQVASACGRRMRLLCNGKPPKGKWLVQRYIHDPLLIYGYKFDLRLYVVVTSYVPLRVYLYDEGLVRFATTPYPRPKNGKGMKVTSSTAHLTNYSINKSNTEGFVNPDDAGGDDDERGSKWVLSTVRRYFASRGWDWKTLWGKVEDLIIKTLLSIESDVAQQLRTAFGPLNPSGIHNCFELYGFDVLIRENLEPILMEVNIMPSLSTRCSLLDQRVKANMIADMLTLVGAYSMEKKPLSKKSRDRKVSETVKMHPFFNGLTPAELDAVCQAEEESLRRTHFTRLFPTATAHDQYRPLFREVKSLNTLLCAWEKAKVVDPPSWLVPPSQKSSVFHMDPKPTLPSSVGGNGACSRGDDDDSDEEKD